MLEHKVLLVLKVLKALKVLKDPLLVRQDLRGLKEIQVPQVL
jgi:hypothetical protein